MYIVSPECESFWTEKHFFEIPSTWSWAVSVMEDDIGVLNLGWVRNVPSCYIKMHLVGVLDHSVEKRKLLSVEEIEKPRLKKSGLGLQWEEKQHSSKTEQQEKKKKLLFASAVNGLPRHSMMRMRVGHRAFLKAPKYFFPVFFNRRRTRVLQCNKANKQEDRKEGKREDASNRRGARRTMMEIPRKVTLHVQGIQIYFLKTCIALSTLKYNCNQHMPSSSSVGHCTWNQHARHTLCYCTSPLWFMA